MIKNRPKINLKCTNFAFSNDFCRYHENERLLPEYDPSMSDNVKVVEMGTDSESTEESNDGGFFPDYFVEERESKHQPKRSMYLATLKLNKVRPEQKGSYKCGPSNTKSAEVELHITDGNPTFQTTLSTVGILVDFQAKLFIFGLFFCLLLVYFWSTSGQFLV